MIRNAIGWLLHWIGQGLKLWLFALIASICLIPIYLPLGLLENGAYRFSELGIPGKVGVVTGYLLCYGLGLAVFTAILASQLKDHPLRPFQPSRKDATELGEKPEEDGKRSPPP